MALFHKLGVISPFCILRPNLQNMPGKPQLFRIERDLLQVKRAQAHTMTTSVRHACTSQRHVRAHPVHRNEDTFEVAAEHIVHHHPRAVNQSPCN